jgi:phytoene/squalene synthetase
MLGSLPGETRDDLYALFHHWYTCFELLDLESPNGLPLDEWCEIRDDLSDAFLDQYTSAPLAALVTTCRKNGVPKQYLFDMLDGADTWTRFCEIKTYDELLVFGYRMGGAPLLVASSILGTVKPGHEASAIRAGQGIFLTFALANFVRDLKFNRVMIAKLDLQQSGVALNRLKLRQSSSEFQRFVWDYATRIESLLCDGQHLAEYLDYDGRRTFCALMSLTRTMLAAMQSNPDAILDPRGVLSKRQRLTLRTRHILGLGDIQSTHS